MTTNPNDRQVGGSHYRDLGVQPWDAMEAWDREHFKGFLRYSALKRLVRWDSKDSALQDVEKAVHELQKLAELLRSEATGAPDHFGIEDSAVALRGVD